MNEYQKKQLEDAILDAAKKDDSTFKEFAERKWRLPPGYPSPERLTACMANIWALAQPSMLRLLGEDSPELERSHRGSFIHYAIGRKFGWPLFFVGGELLEALKRTTPNPQWNLTELPLPFPAFSFAFHDKSLTTPDGETVTFVSVAAYQGGEYPAFGTRIAMKGHTFILQVHAREGTQTYMVEQIKDGVVEAVSRPFEDLTENASKEGRTEEGNRFLSNVFALVHNLVAVMDARPELVEDCEIVARKYAKKYNRKKNPETPGKGRRQFMTPIWSPNFIGKDFRFQREVSEDHDTKRPVRMHWRRGHFRQQRHGKGRTLTKQIWIDPMLVAGQPNQD